MSSIDVRDWNSAVATQFKIRSLPSFAVYDGNGKLVMEGDSATEWVRAQIERADKLPTRKAPAR